MDWFHRVAPILGILFAVLAPAVLVQALQHREWQRLFELVVTTLWMCGFLLMTLSPSVLQNAWASWPPLRWLWLLLTTLFLANFFGFSGWLFSRHRKRQI